MNRKEVKQTIKDTMQLDPGLVSNVERERFIDDIIDDLGSLGVWQATYSVSVSASPVDMPATFSSLINAYWNDTRLGVVDSFNVPPTVPSGMPVFCWVGINGKLNTYPSIGSAGILKVEFISKGMTIPTDASGTGTDLTDLTTYGVPVEWHKVIADGAISRAHRKNGNITAAREYRNDYETAKNAKYVQALEKLNESRRQNDDQPRTFFGPDIFIPPGWGV